jgi:hypothetical protein
MFCNVYILYYVGQIDELKIHIRFIQLGMEGVVQLQHKLLHIYNGLNVQASNKWPQRTFFNRTQAFSTQIMRSPNVPGYYFLCYSLYTTCTLHLYRNTLTIQFNTPDTGIEWWFQFISACCLEEHFWVSEVQRTMVASAKLLLLHGSKCVQLGPRWHIFCPLSRSQKTGPG